MPLIKCEGGLQIVTDLEATCWTKGEDPRQGSENETIEIGSVFCDHNFQPLAEFQSFVRPVRNPKLSAFCTELTTITQAEVDSAPTFPEVLANYQAFVKRTFDKALRKVRWYSWGNYDKNQYEKDCLHWQVDYPFGPHLNAKNEVAKALGARRMGLARMAERLKIVFEGTHHRAISDARVAAKICLIALAKGKRLDEA